jgi:hypothetical protein
MWVKKHTFGSLSRIFLKYYVIFAASYRTIDIIIRYMIIGRKQEIKTLKKAYDSKRSEFVAVYGRRRVGKTFLIKEALEGSFTFTHTGLAKATKSNQLKGFQASLKKAGCNCSKPKTWLDAFLLLEEWIESLPDGRKVIFLDELPWMDTPRSKRCANRLAN